MFFIEMFLIEVLLIGIFLVETSFNEALLIETLLVEVSLIEMLLVETLLIEMLLIEVIEFCLRVGLISLATCFRIPVIASDVSMARGATFQVFLCPNLLFAGILMKQI